MLTNSPDTKFGAMGSLLSLSSGMKLEKMPPPCARPPAPPSPPVPSVLSAPAPPSPPLARLHDTLELMMSIKPLTVETCFVVMASAGLSSEPPAKMPPPWALPPSPPSLESSSSEELMPAPPAPPMAQLLLTFDLLTKTSADEVWVLVVIAGFARC